MVDYDRLRTARRLVYPLVAIAAGAISSELRTGGAWRLLALWSAGGDFGTRDPLFHRDVGFFVFSLPLYQQVSRLGLRCAGDGDGGDGRRLRVAGRALRARARAPPAGSRGTRARRDGLALPARSVRARAPARGLGRPGSAYTDVHVRLPLARVLTLACARRRRAVRATPPRGRSPAVRARGRAVSPRSRFRPERPAGRRRAVRRRAAGSSRASGRTSRRPSPRRGTRSRSTASTSASCRAATQLSAADLAADRRTIDNVPLWDASVLRPALDDSAVDRRATTASRPRRSTATTSTASRSCSPSRPASSTCAHLTADARCWANDRFAYTHGYGVVAVRAAARTTSGHPRFIQREFGRRTARAAASRASTSRERTRPDPPYVVVSSRRGEVDRPPRPTPPAYHYDGGGGIALVEPAAAGRVRGPLRRPRSCCSPRPPPASSRIMLHRDVRDRAAHAGAVPALGLASADRGRRRARAVPVPRLHDAASRYPYAAPVPSAAARQLPARVGAGASWTRSTAGDRLYAADADDPILRAWRGVYPGLFAPRRTMPAELRAHLRYPRRLFNAQAGLYATYHADEPTGVLERRRRLAAAAADRGTARERRRDPLPRPETAGDDERWPAAAPAYLLARLPGDARAASCSPAVHAARAREPRRLPGRLDRRAGGAQQLTLLSLPRDRLDARADAGHAPDPRRPGGEPAARARSTASRATSGEDSVNRTILGAPRVVPIGDALVHVQPIYVTAGGSGVPRLQLVTVLRERPRRLWPRRSSRPCAGRSIGRSSARTSAGSVPALGDQHVDRERHERERQHQRVTTAGSRN